MIRSRTVNTIHELASQGKSIQDIAITLGIARNTVRKYLRHPELVDMPHPPPNHRSKLDPFKDQVKKWIEEDHCYNCEAMVPRLLAMGYQGSLSVLKRFVHPLRPPMAGHYPVVAEQVQFDWGEFQYEQDGAPHKLSGFTAILSYSRLRFVTFVKRCDAQTLIRCLMEAFEYFGGLPKAALTDRMKRVFLDMDGKTPIWNPLFADFMASLGVSPRVCRPFKPQTKGKVERSVGVIKNGFWPGVHFTDIDHLNGQAKLWCDRLNQKVHRTTRKVPLDRWVEENLTPLPKEFAWERFGAEERKVSWDGFISYDGVYYGLPADPPVAGAVVLVRERKLELRIYHQGQLITTLTKRPRSHDIVQHPDQFKGVEPVAPLNRTDRPLGHQVAGPVVSVRNLAEYDQLFGVEVSS